MLKLILYNGEIVPFVGNVQSYTEWCSISAQLSYLLLEDIKLLLMCVISKLHEFNLKIFDLNEFN